MKLLTILLCSQLSGCFFFLIPGSVTGKVEDGITGARGNYCVATNAKVGDKIKLPDDSILYVKSLSGESARCTAPEYPIRAELVNKESI